MGGLFLLLLLHLTGLGTWLEELTVALRLNLQPPPATRNKVAIVAIGSEGTLEHTIPLRDTLAPLLEQLGALPPEQQPQRIVLDLLLTLPSPPTANGVPESGQRVAVAAGTLRRVVHPIMVDELPGGRPIPYSALEMLGPHLWPNPGVAAGTIYQVRLAHPELAPTLYRGARGVGSMTLPRRQKKQDELFRLPLFSRVEVAPGAPSLLPGLGMAAVLSSKCEGTPREECLQLTSGWLWNTLSIGTVQPIQVPLDPEGQLSLRYHRSFGPKSRRVRDDSIEGGLPREGCPAFTTIRQATAGAPVVLMDGGNQIPLEILRGCYVLIVDWQEEDGQRLPLGQGAREYTIHAQIMANLLDEDFIRPLPPGVAWGLSIPMTGAYLGTLAWKRRHRKGEKSSAAPRSPSNSEAMGRMLASSWYVEPLRRWMSVPVLYLSVLWWVAAHGAFVLIGVLIPVVLPLAMVLGMSLTRQLIAAPLLRRRVRVIESEREALAISGETLAVALERVEEALYLAQSDKASLEQVVGGSQLRVLEQANLLADQQLKSRQQLDANEARRQQENAEAQQAIEAALEQQARNSILRARAALARLSGLPRRNPSMREKQEFIGQHSLPEKLAALQAALQELESKLEQHMAPPGDLSTLTEVVRERFRLLEQLHQRTVEGMEALAKLERDAVIQPEVASPAKDSEMLPQPDPELARLGFCTVDERLVDRIKGVLSDLRASAGPVLITGDTGIGKRTLAVALHKAMRGDARAFVVIEGGVLGPRELRSRLDDLARRAAMGTLYVHHLEALPHDLQRRVVDIYDKRAGRKDGFVLLCSVNQVAPLTSRSVHDTTLDASVYQQLQSRLVHLPPLQERRGEIHALCRYFLLSSKEQQECQITDEARRLMQHGYFWPSNRRELKQVLAELVQEAKQGFLASAETPTIRINETTRLDKPRCIVDDVMVLSWLHPPLQDVLTRLELHRLRRMRFNGFSTAQSAQDPGYHEKADHYYSRAAIDLHRCQLFAKVLVRKGFDVSLMVTALAGSPDGPLRAKVWQKVNVWLANMKRWPETDADARLDYYDSYRAYAEQVHQALSSPIMGIKLAAKEPSNGTRE